MQNSGNKGGIIVRHREYIGDINPSSDFVNRRFPINPGLGSTFPWLSQVSDAFEEYEFKGLIFEFRSLASDTTFSTTSTGLGSVILCTNYNANQNPFNTKRDMENYEFANSGKPSVNILHAVECAKGVTPVTRLYVRTGEPPVNEDKRLYDLGVFNIATQGQQGEQDGVIGEMWATYEVEFFKPKYRGSIGSNLLGDHFQLSAERGNLLDPTPEAPFGTLPLINRTTPPTVDNGEFILGCDLADGKTIVFPRYVSGMSFMIVMNFTANTPMFPVDLTRVLTGPIQITKAFADGAVSYTSGGAAATPTADVYNYVIPLTVGQITDEAPTATFTFSTLDAGEIQLIDIYIVQINAGLLVGPNNSAINV